MLRVNALTGFGAGGAPPVEIVGSIAGDVSTAAGTTHNMGSFDVGVSDANKKCLLGITTKDAASHLITGVTLGGVALTEMVTQQHFAGPFYINAAIWGGDISSKSGSQAIVVTMAGNTLRRRSPKPPGSK